MFQHPLVNEPDRHKFFLDIDDEYVGVRVECPYTKVTASWGEGFADKIGQHVLGSDVDTTRPCWPHHENGVGEWVPDDAPQSECTYESRADNVALDEIIHGRCSVEIPNARWLWDDVGPTIEVGE